jgi:hypothetical protein
MKAIYVANNDEYLAAKDYSKLIDGYDTVVRHNDCAHLGGNAGTKTNILVVQKTRSVLDMGLHPEKLELIKQQKPMVMLLCWKWSQDDFIAWITGHQLFLDKGFIVVSGAEKHQLRQELKELGSKLPHQPSSGIWSHHILKKLLVGYDEICLLGFASEGSDHHDWHAEKAYWKNEIQWGRVVRHE